MKRSRVDAKRILRNRNRLHARTNRALDAIIDAARDFVLAPAMSARMRWQRVPLPPAIVPPDAERRVLVAPLNFAGQGHAWARAIGKSIPHTKATNLDIQHPGDFGFPTDASVPMNVQRYDRRWQVQQSRAIVQGFTHVLVESETAIFGRLFGENPERERRFLSANGVSTAYVCHGSDIRSPEKHKLTTRFSPFGDAGVYYGRVQRRVDRNRVFLEATGSPVFVSTPDLLNDFPEGIWLPVVVDLAEWSSAGTQLGVDVDSDDHRTPPLVVHLPSRELVKGSHLIREPLEDLERMRVIRYRAVTGVPASEARRIIKGADIVLDQFRLGSYGVAACEAMAAGRVVVGHVTHSVRELVLERTGLELPIVEADPDNIGPVLEGLARDAQRMRALAREGQKFVSEVHSGNLSADILSRFWLNR